MKHELSVDREQVMEDLRKALNIPDRVWEHDDRTWTVKDLEDLFDLGNNAARSRAEEAVENGVMIQGYVQGARGHFVSAYRLACDS